MSKQEYKSDSEAERKLLKAIFGEDYEPPKEPAFEPQVDTEVYHKLNGRPMHVLELMPNDNPELSECRCSYWDDEGAYDTAVVRYFELLPYPPIPDDTDNEESEDDDLDELDEEEID